MKKIIIVVLLCFSAVCINAAPNELLIGVENAEYPPFYFTKDGKLTGICTDLVNEAASMLGMKTVYNDYPWKRMLNKAKFGEIDAVMPVFKTKERMVYLYYPESELTHEENVFFIKRGSGIKYKGDFRNLKPYEIGVVQGKSYGELFDRVNYFKKQTAVNGLIQMRQFKIGRFQVGIGNKDVVKNYASKQGILKNIIFLTPLVTKEPLYIGFSKIKGPKVAKRFSNAINKLKLTGKYQQILRKYNVE